MPAEQRRSPAALTSAPWTWRLLWFLLVPAPAGARNLRAPSRFCREAAFLGRRHREMRGAASKTWRSRNTATHLSPLYRTDILAEEKLVWRAARLNRFIDRKWSPAAGPQNLTPAHDKTVGFQSGTST
jgi:hypothetical protein